jgi:hypothetical protein
MSEERSHHPLAVKIAKPGTLLAAPQAIARPYIIGTKTCVAARYAL